MKRPGPNYRMSKAGKTYLAVTWHRPHKAARRRALVQAELYASEVIRPRKERNDA